MKDERQFQDLLQLCLWDLGAGARLAAERMPGILSFACASQLHKGLLLLVAEWRQRGAQLSRLSKKKEGPDNLWMAGMLDDAHRDCETLPKGPILDIAMIGAVRKMLHAEAASIETADRLAAGLSEGEIKDQLLTCSNSCDNRDTRLRKLLDELTGVGLRR